MAATYYWIKLYYDLLDDYKVGNLPDSLKWRFIQCLLVAGETRAGGFLPRLEEMAYRLRPMNPESLGADLTRLAQAGLAELKTDGDGDERWFVTNFEKRQKAKSNAERQKSWRARRSDNEEVTTPLQDNNEPVTSRYLDSDIDSDIDESKTPLPPKPKPKPKGVSCKTPQDYANLNNAEFIELWQDWKRYKGASIKTMTYNRQLKKADDQVSQHGIAAVCGIFNLTMDNGWKGLLWDKLAGGRYNGPNENLTIRQRAEKAFDDMEGWE